MKNCILKFTLLLVCFTYFVRCENPSVNREYYNSGVVKVEEYLNKQKKVIYRKEYYENGKICAEASFSDGLLDGVFTKYYYNGRVEFEKEFNMGKEVGYISFDSIGNKDYWLRSLTKADIPVFKEEFFQVVSYNDSGFIVNLSVPDISPFQILPVTKNANWESIDIKKGDWLILPKEDSIEVAIGIELTDSTFYTMKFKSINIRELKASCYKLPG